MSEVGEVTESQTEQGAEDAMEFDDEDQTPVIADGEDGDALGTGSSPTANIIATAGMNLLPDKNLAFLSDELNKRQRCNAKAVEWLSMEGEHLGQFRSGFEAAKALNVTQGDISLCCRGMRQQVGGYKFRFVAEEARPEAKLKRGFAYEPVVDEGAKDLSLAETRRTRASRGEFGATGGEAPAPLVPKISVLAPPILKVRKWRKVLVKLGNLIIPKWVSDQEQPTAELQDLLPKKDINRGKKRKSIFVGRGSTAHEILGDYED